MKLNWRVGLGGGSRYMPFADSILITDEDVEEGKAPAALAHELAHRREGIFTHIVTEPSERTFWKELAVWQSAMERGLSPDEIDKELIEDSLGSHLQAVEYDYGTEHLQYRMAKEAYDEFIRRYL